MITRESKNILVTDDSEFFRIKLSELLTKAGHVVTVARDGNDVVEILERDITTFDLLILDLHMPGMDGFAVLSWLGEKQLLEKLPVLAVTGVYDPSHVHKRLKGLGAMGLMTKALNPEQVLYMVNCLLFPDKAAQGSPRVPISIPVDITTEKSTFTGYLLNISASGLFLHVERHLPIDSKVNMTFSLPGYNIIMGYDGTLHLKGVVMWCTATSGEENFFGGAGISFLGLSHGTEELLNKFVRRERDRLGLEIQDI